MHRSNRPCTHAPTFQTAWVRKRRQMVRYIVAILGLLLVIGTLVGIKTAQISSLIQSGEAFAKAGPPPESVSIDVSRDLSWEGTLSAVGSIAAARGVAVSNDSPGVVKKHPLRVGRRWPSPGRSWSSSTPASSARSSPRPRRGASWPSQTSSATRSLRRERRRVAVAARQRRVAAQGRQRRRRARCRRRSSARSCARRSPAGSASAQVNLGQYLSPGTTAHHARGARLGVRRLHPAAAGAAQSADWA